MTTSKDCGVSCGRKQKASTTNVTNGATLDNKLTLWPLSHVLWGGKIPLFFPHARNSCELGTSHTIRADCPIRHISSGGVLLSPTTYPAVPASHHISGHNSQHLFTTLNLSYDTALRVAARVVMTDVRHATNCTSGGRCHGILHN